MHMLQAPAKGQNKDVCGLCSGSRCCRACGSGCLGVYMLHMRCRSLSCQDTLTQAWNFGAPSEAPDAETLPQLACCLTAAIAVRRSMLVQAGPGG